jgi:hypothetical protein
MKRFRNSNSLAGNSELGSDWRRQCRRRRYEISIFPFAKRLKDQSLVHALTGVWVNSECRKRGLANKLHRVTIDWTNRHARDEIGYSERKNGLLVTAEGNNRAALF